MCENIARFCPTLPGPRFARAEILLCLYEASCPVCQGTNGPRDIVFMRMAPVIGCQPSATPVNRARVYIYEKVPPEKLGSRLFTTELPVC